MKYVFLRIFFECLFVVSRKYHHPLTPKPTKDQTKSILKGELDQ